MYVLQNINSCPIDKDYVLGAVEHIDKDYVLGAVEHIDKDYVLGAVEYIDSEFPPLGPSS